jgi:hypothetical protein
VIPEVVGPEDLYEIGTICKIHHTLVLPHEAEKVMVQGLERLVTGPYTQSDPYLAACVTRLPDLPDGRQEIEALMQSVTNQLRHFIGWSRGDEKRQPVIRGGFRGVAADRRLPVFEKGQGIFRREGKDHKSARSACIRRDCQLPADSAEFERLVRANRTVCGTK